MRINLDELLDLAAKVEAARADVKTQAETLLHSSEKANRLEAALRALVEGEPEIEEPAVLGTGPDTGSNIKTREWRWRHAQYGGLEKEYRYGGSDYVRQAKLLGLSRTGSEIREVWLTEEEIPTVREAVYTARVASGLKTGVPRNRLNGRGGE
tara:strand:+ start:87 stop:545 length:459 start_codon:yes stop_codon:yes gene_type:complete